MKYLFVFLLVGLMVSCGNDATGNASENVKPKLKEYSWDEVTSPNDTTFLKKNMKPVTGIVTKWHENGRPHYKNIYKDGKLEGLSRYWYENGQLRMESNFKDGKQKGLRRMWQPNGQLLFEENNKDGEEGSFYRFWYSNGQLKSEKKYKDGRWLSNCFNEEGNLIKCD